LFLFEQPLSGDKWLLEKKQPLQTTEIGKMVKIKIPLTAGFLF